MARKRLTTRLIGLSIFWVILTLLATLLLINRLYRDHIEQHYDAHVFNNVEELIAAVTIGPDGPAELSRQPTDPRFYRAQSGWYWQVMVGGEVLARSRSLEDKSVDVSELNFDENHNVQPVRGPNGLSLRALVVHMSHEYIPEPIAIVATSPEMQIADDVTGFNTHVILGFVLLAFGLSLAVFLQVYVALRPLKGIRESISEVKAGHIDRLPRDFPLDVQPLVDELNSLLDHNEMVLRRARTQVADLAHLVNTPLTVIRNEARKIPSQEGLLILDQAHAMSGSIDRYLSHARVSGQRAGFGLHSSLKSVLDDLQFALERIYSHRNIEITLSCVKDECRFRGDTQDLEEMVGNLLENAFKWARQKVEVRCRCEHDRMTIFIEDDGPGIRKEDFDAVLKRGRKLDESTAGYGQGLAIVCDIAKLYGGELKLGRSSLGGLRAELELPDAS